MEPWPHIPDLVASLLLVSAGLATLFALGLIVDRDAPDEGHTWGDDPTVVAMLSGMSL